MSSAASPRGLKVYRPTVKRADIYFPHPGVRPMLRYNHDVDSVRFKGRCFAAWDANEVGKEAALEQSRFHHA
ncbi:MAG: hypothetical protein FJ279_22555 [Planctomycetes bacterium]|nr:hypothetical protein [Planctomycetota bacterium]